MFILFTHPFTRSTKADASTFCLAGFGMLRTQKDSGASSDLDQYDFIEILRCIPQNNRRPESVPAKRCGRPAAGRVRTTTVNILGAMGGAMERIHGGQH